MAVALYLVGLVGLDIYKLLMFYLLEARKTRAESVIQNQRESAEEGLLILHK